MHARNSGNEAHSLISARSNQFFWFANFLFVRLFFYPHDGPHSKRGTASCLQTLAFCATGTYLGKGRGRWEGYWVHIRAPWALGSHDTSVLYVIKISRVENRVWEYTARKIFNIEFGRLGTRLKVPLVSLIRVKKEASGYHTYLFNRLAVSGDNLRAYSRHKLLSDSHVPGK